MAVLCQHGSRAGDLSAGEIFGSLRACFAGCSRYALWLGLIVLLSACGVTGQQVSLQGHLSAESEQLSASARTARQQYSGEDAAGPKEIPARHAEPSRPEQAETYSVVAHEVPVRDLLFALARDAKLNVDIHPGLSGVVTMNAVQQTLPQILERVARQVEMRVEMDGGNLAVMPDTPFLRNYRVDYVNMSRSMSGEVASTTQIASGLPGSAGDGNSSFMSGNGNGSATRVENLSGNRFWDSLEQGIKSILQETDKIFPAEEREETGGAFSSSAIPVERQDVRNARDEERATARRSTFREAASVIIHRESGVVTVRATGRQHDRVKEFIESVANAAHRQVMIEATIVEVALNDGYQQGIEWSRFWDEGRKIFTLTQAGRPTGQSAAISPFSIGYSDISRRGNLFAATLSLLESFGSTRVLSSPRLSVLNNQTALLKVVENVVYFNIRADVTPGGSNSNPVVAYSSTPQTVSVGIVMTVTPQIGDDETVILNVRPTISSIASMVKDPNPDIPSHIANEIPQIRTREIESVLRLGSGEIAVLGGLMEDRVDRDSGRVPLVGNIPLIKELFTSRYEGAKKSELVIFLRPIVLNNATLNGDFSGLRETLPDAAFWTNGADGFSR
ncbi:MAG: type II and III secretion system protein [Betaproteobacteria bacterium]|nr:type II and III secretion system protein [Betaproteobacteria bacterium]